MINEPCSGCRDVPRDFEAGRVDCSDQEVEIRADRSSWNKNPPDGKRQNDCSDVSRYAVPLHRGQTRMTSSQNRNIVNRMIEEIQNGKNVGLCDELFSDNFINHTPPANFTPTRDGMRQLFAIHTAFPDGHLVVEDQIADEGKVWTRKMFKGMHTGMFGSISPTGRVIDYQVMDILALESGKMTAHWDVVDRLGLLRQLGAIS